MNAYGQRKWWKIMAKKVKAIDPKMVAKNEVMAVVMQALAEAGYSVKDGKDYAMTSGTIVVAVGNYDVQIKPISPKTGVDKYTLAE